MNVFQTGPEQSSDSGPQNTDLGPVGKPKNP